ncbi:MAG: AAA family ATPase [Ignavibacteriaceae bacterium]|nr:AAA family ATPase [Ignavibacteriaceae bacterium]
MNQIAANTVGHSNFTLLVGKRKVGKTTLIKQFLRTNAGAYFTISNKSSFLQLQDISEYLKSYTFPDSFIPTFQSWGNFFEFLFYIARNRPVNVVIDEFHNFELIEPEAFDELKKMWDTYSKTSMLNLIVVTSNIDFMKRKFESKESPLFRINNHFIKLTPFRLSDVIVIFRMNGSKLSTNQIIELYTIFGGLPKYYFLIERHRLWNKDLETILKELVFVDFAPLAYELKELLINDFTRGNKIYLSILQAIAAGFTKMSDIAKTVNIPVTNLTKYLFELEKKKRLIERQLPVNTNDGSRSKFGRYFIRNYFENFWFRFIQPDIINFEMGEYDKMLTNISEKLGEYVNHRLGIFIREIFHDYQHSHYIQYLFPFEINKVGSVWNRKDTIEIVVVSESARAVLYANLVIQDEPLNKYDVNMASTQFFKFKTLYANYSKRYLLITKNGIDSGAEAFCKQKNIANIDINVFFDALVGDATEADAQIIEVEV